MEKNVWVCELIASGGGALPYHVNYVLMKVEV